MSVLSWSHSKIVEFEKCKYRTFLMQVEKKKEPERPLAPGKTEHANDRGSRIHDILEHHVRGTADLPREAMTFATEFAAMRRLYDAGMVSLEGEWGMNQAWEPANWHGEWLVIDDDSPEDHASFIPVKTLPERPRAGDMVLFRKQYLVWTPPWLRLKLDALVFLSEHEAVAIDYKTGKKFGNELKHAEQLQLYQLVTFLRYPQLDSVTTELWYLDEDDLTTSTFTRMQGLRFQRSWDKRGTNFTTCQDFPPNPNIHSCRYCGYGPWGSNDCTVGVQATSFPKRR